MMRAAASLALAAALFGTCGKKDGASADAATSAATADAGPTTATATASASASAAPAAAASKWALSYTISAGTLYIPEQKDWSATHYKQDESKLVGAGSMTLTVDASGRVSGGADDPPLGPAVVEGVVENGTLAGTVRRKDPKDGGLTGTLLAKLAGDKLDGEMKLAEANASIVRVAKVSGSLSKGP